MDEFERAERDAGKPGWAVTVLGTPPRLKAQVTIFEVDDGRREVLVGLDAFDGDGRRLAAQTFGAENDEAWQTATAKAVEALRVLWYDLHGPF